MEILATNTSYAAAIFLTITFALVALILVAIMVDAYKEAWERALAATALAPVLAAIIMIWFDPTYVTYDAIVTDWNEVYEQGYEVVETSGKIVTLRKVDE